MVIIQMLRITIAVVAPFVLLFASLRAPCCKLMQIPVSQRPDGAVDPAPVRAALVWSRCGPPEGVGS